MVKRSRREWCGSPRGTNLIVGSLMLGPIVEVAILNKPKGSKVEGYFNVQLKSLIGIGYHTLGFKIVEEKLT